MSKRSKTQMCGFCIGLLVVLVGGMLLLNHSSPGVLSAHPLSVIDACGEITTDTTWTAGNVYTATDCNVVVPAGVTLTVEPGVVVKFAGVSPGYGSMEGSAALIVAGTLDVQGTPTGTVAFTSLADDEHGGDTNDDGASSGAAGDWYGIVFQEGSTGALQHFFVGYAGSGVFNNAVGYGRAQIDVKSASVNLRDGMVTDGLEKGIYLDGEGLTPAIERVEVANNNAADGRGSAIYQSSINMQPSYADLTFSDNDHNEVTIGRFNYPMTEDVILGGTNYGFRCDFTACVMEVSTHTLTVMPGTLLDFSSRYGIGSLGSPYGIVVADGGTLIAEGTPTQPITFTSKLAAEGADLQNWAGLWAQEGSTLRLDHCDISYARSSNGGKGGLEINTDNAEVDNSHIHHNADDGLVIKGNAESTLHPTFADVNVTDNGKRGVYMDAGLVGIDLSLTWEGGNISRNGQAGIESQTWRSDIFPSFTGVTVSDNGESGIDFSDVDGRIHPVLENVTLAGNTGTAMAWTCDGNIEARNLIATGNGADVLETGCDINGGRQWDLGDVGIPISVTGHIVVLNGGLLSVGPGTTLRFDKADYGADLFLRVNSNADLYAVGTADEPIVFTGAEAEPGYWYGILASDGAGIVLHHCEIAYGGASSGTASLDVRGNSVASPSPVSIQNCHIHDSASKGVRFRYVTETPAFRYNRVHDNAQEGLVNEHAPDLDARHNWWGDASGPYHPTLNPDGTGDEVGDHVIFYPWLSAPTTGAEALGEMIVSTGAPKLISPGEGVDYAIQYLNEMTTTVAGGVLMLQLPFACTYIDGTHDAVYWPDRHQVIWKLGDVEPGDQDYVSARVRFHWGLPVDYTDGTFTHFAGENYNAAAFDVAEYRAYESPQLRVTDIDYLSESEFAGIRGDHADLESLYQAALAEGFEYLSAARITFHDGSRVWNAAMRTPDRQYGRILSLTDADEVLASTVGGGQLVVNDMLGGLTTSLTTRSYEWEGAWIPADNALLAVNSCDENRCFANCMIKAKSWGAVAGKMMGLVTWVIPPVGAVWTGYQIYDEVATYQECKQACKADTSSHCCTPGDVRWAPTGIKQQCAQYSCDAVGTWHPAPTIIEKCGFGERCVAGKGTASGCVECEEDLLAAAFTPVSVASVDAVCATSASMKNCSELTVRRAKDPNAIYGPAGDLLPDDVVTYTITYENEGAGRAYGVYVVNELPEAFDAGTLTFVHGGGAYLTNTREIFWSVGELGPKGDPDSEGAITYTVALTGGVPSGTVVSNQAVVYFPSVPEETPTNSWVNLVAPLVATPQDLTTDYATPLTITLSGREVSGLPLTYEIVEDPHGGTLTGTLPNLIYTPVENFTGADGFTFRVRNDITTSQAAQVYITVTPDGDTTPPEVTWTNPAADAEDIVASSAPLFTDTVGPAYSPVILIGVSEPLSETTVSSATVTLARVGGTDVHISAHFDEGLRQIVVSPRAALTPGDYEVTVGSPVADLAGNPLAEEYVWRFDTGESPYRHIYLPLVLRQ